VLIVGGQAEPLCEQLEAGDEVELTGKLQRGEVVCFKVHVRRAARASVPQDETFSKTDASGSVESGAPINDMEPVPGQKARKRALPRHLQRAWHPEHAN
jgi:hypothetical protein